MQDDPVSRLLHIVTIGVFVVAGGLVLLMILAALNRFRLKRKAGMPEARSVDLQSGLLEAIKIASANQRTEVDIRPFWKNGDVRAIDRHAVIEPLVARGDVTKASEPHLGEPWDALRGWWQIAFYRPPTRLVLTDRTWTRMVHEGVSGRGIVIGTYIERADKVSEYKMDTGGGDVIGSPMGPRAKARNVRATKGDTVSSMPTDLLLQLVAALRTDAVALGEDPRRDVRRLADDLEDALNEPKPDEDRILGMVSRASRFTRGAASLMRSSHGAIEALNDWI